MSVKISNWQKVKLETLTPVHVGSGVFLQKGSDFITFNEDGYKMLGVIDEQKVFNLIGKEERNIQQWVVCIERKGDIMQLINNLSAGHHSPNDYCKRTIQDFSKIDCPSLKEYIHDGMGHPYIPGSSLKGAIRTAILATVMKGFIRNNRVINVNTTEQAVFGETQNSVFRFLKVGDAIFKNGCEEATRLINLNIRPSYPSLKDESKSQLVECIGPESSTEFNIKLEEDYNKMVAHTQDSATRILPREMSTLNEMFSVINEHTKKLLKEEIQFWRDEEKTGQQDYIEEIKNVLRASNNCQEGECVMRLGHASGWRFITGAWTEQLDDFDSLIPPVARPKNTSYQDLPFPKSRRLDDESYILGFVKMSVR